MLISAYVFFSLRLQQSEEVRYLRSPLEMNVQRGWIVYKFKQESNVEFDVESHMEANVELGIRQTWSWEFVEKLTFSLSSSYLTFSDF